MGEATIVMEMEDQYAIPKEDADLLTMLCHCVPSGKANGRQSLPDRIIHKEGFVTTGTAWARWADLPCLSSAPQEMKAERSERCI